MRLMTNTANTKILPMMFMESLADGLLPSILDRC
jgi:hypothetical protein